MRRSLIFSFAGLLSLVSVACGDDGPVGGEGGAGGQGVEGGGGAVAEGGAGGGGGGTSCPEGSHEGASGCEATLGQWSATSSLTRARDHHVSFVAEAPSGTYLYAMLGTTSLGSGADTVERATLGEDGTLGAFELQDDFPEAIIGAGFAQVDRSFVVAGGLVEPGNSWTTTYVGSVNDDGSLAIAESEPLGVSRYHLTATAVGGYVFAIGGMSQDVSGPAPVQEVMPTIERASFDGTTLGAWEELEPLAGPLTHHAAVAHDGAIYLIGGGEGLPAKTDIVRATVGDDGSLSAFSNVGTLPEGRATSSAFVFLDHLYVVAGMAQLTGEERATVLAAPIDAEGNVGAFVELAELPLARAHAHQAPRSGPFVFSIGGSIAHMPQKDVFFARFE
ncbi:MAG: hypothetical protein HOW73_22945 [Polyangiaceae bacterium]|nr:hypothetical protein [Polyangiaceae bacterium]